MPCACWLCPRISIHALREEGDQAPQTRKEQAKYFYPRPPRGGRSVLGGMEHGQYAGSKVSVICISVKALRLITWTK